MAADVVWLDQASDDVRALLDHIYPENPRAALQYIGDLEQACNGLADFPLQGRQYDERYHAIVVRNHLIFYRYEVEDDKVVVAAVIDGRRDLTQVLEDRQAPTECSPLDVRLGTSAALSCDRRTVARLQVGLQQGASQILHRRTPGFLSTADHRIPPDRHSIPRDPAPRSRRQGNRVKT